MKVFFGAIIFAFVAHGIDAYPFNGKYTTALVQVTSDIVRHFH